MPAGGPTVAGRPVEFHSSFDGPAAFAASVAFAVLILNPLKIRRCRTL
jgi:hypothetical protein